MAHIIASLVAISMHRDLNAFVPFIARGWLEADAK
jgi:hypothetical protein